MVIDMIHNNVSLVSKEIFDTYAFNLFKKLLYETYYLMGTNYPENIFLIIKT